MSLFCTPAAAGAVVGTVELKPGAPAQAGTFGAASGIGVGHTVADGIRLESGLGLGASTVRGASPAGRLKVGSGRRRVTAGSPSGPQWVFGNVAEGLRLTLRHNGVRQQRLRVLSPGRAVLVKQRSGAVAVRAGGVELGTFSAVAPGSREQAVTLAVSGRDLVIRFSATAGKRSVASVAFADATREHNGGWQFAASPAGSARGKLKSGRLLVTTSAASWLPWAQGGWTWTAPGDAQLTKASGVKARGKPAKGVFVTAELVGRAKVLLTRSLKTRGNTKSVDLSTTRVRQLRMSVLTVGNRTATAALALPRLTIVDRRPPVVESVVPRAPWMRAGDATLDVVATDSGTGVRELTISGAVRATLRRPCAIDDSVACPARWAASIPLTGLDSGRHTVDVAVIDRAGRTTTRRDVGFAIDTSPATLGVSVEGGTWTNRASVGVRVVATDPESGIAQVAASLGGVSLGSETGAAHTFTVDARALAEGMHRGEVVGTNGAGAQNTTMFELGVDRTPPRLTFNSALEGTSPLLTDALDAPVTATDHASGLAEIELEVDGRPVAAGSRLDPRTLEAGEHELTVVATDKAGNRTTGAARFRTEYVPPTPLSETETTDLATSSEFLYKGVGAPQKGLTKEIEPTRIAVIRGRVSGPDGKPMDGVTVRVADHPEYGRVVSESNGTYSLVVNGGGQVVVTFEREGYLTIERPVQTPWQDYIWADDVAMTPIDSKGTEVALSPATADVQVAESSTVRDADGSRNVTMMFKPGTQAVMVMPGGERRPVTKATVRASEYTVGEFGLERMPGNLPPQTAYTYAAEFSLDEAMAAGAETVEFSKPVPAYIQNFLGVRAGARVPTGYYDRAAHAWKPMVDGMTVKVLSKGGGVASLDTAGTGLPAPQSALDALGIDEAELREIARRFEPGDTLTRLYLKHFTPIDGNHPYMMPPGARGPDGSFTENQTSDDCAASGSVIGCENQTLGESIPIAGTGLSLHYESDRVPGSEASRSVRMKVVGDTVPDKLSRIEIRARIAGRDFTKSLPVAANAEWEFTWDGKDAFGRTVLGGQQLRVEVGYFYKFNYWEGVPYTFAAGESASGAFTSSWAGPANYALSGGGGGGGGGGSGGGGVMLAGDAAEMYRIERPIWQLYTKSIAAWDQRSAGLGGWSLSEHHSYDPTTRTLRLGDGSERRVDDQAKTINILDYRIGIRGVDGVDTDAAKQGGIQVAPDGTIFYSDFYHDEIWKRTPDGQLTKIAGNPPDRPWAWTQGGFGGDGGPAQTAQIDGPRSILLEPDGGLLFADTGNLRIRRISPDGRITTVMGDGSRTYPGDGRLATEAGLAGYTVDLARAPDGGFYVLDGDGDAVRHVDRSGRVTTAWQSACTLGPDCPDYFGRGRSIAIGPDGSIWVAGASWAGSSRVVAKAPDGSMRLAGSYKGTNRGRPDGLPFNESEVEIEDLRFGPDGLLYMLHRNFRDPSDAERVLRLDPDGVVRTVAGGDPSVPNVENLMDGLGGNRFGSGEGGPPRRADLAHPSDLAIGPDGTIYLATFVHGSIHRIGTSLPGFTNDNIAIPSEDGTEVYKFDKNGRHLSTLDALTGKALLTFGYDSAGLLDEVKDEDGNSVRVEHDGGRPKAIVGAYGARTSLATDSDGWLTSVTEPEGGMFRMTYGTSGLLSTFENPEGGISKLSYESDGRLRSDEDPDGPVKTLSRTLTSDGHRVSLSTASGLTSVFSLGRTTAGLVERKVTAPSGAVTTQTSGEGTKTTTQPDGTVATSTERGDPRLGMAAPYNDSESLTLPSGLKASITRNRTATLARTADWFSHSEIKETTTTNGKTSTVVYTASNKTAKATSAAGRIAESVLDDRGREVEARAPDVDPVRTRYDNRGRVDQIKQGARTWTYSYDTGGNLSRVEGPEQLDEGYRYDRTGRTVAKRLSDGREIGFGYDKAGRLTSVTPPSRPQHRFGISKGGRLETATPPVVAGLADTAERYSYNSDGQLKSFTQPGGNSTSYAYDTAGRPKTVSAGADEVALRYQADGARELDRISNGGQHVEYGYDGPLPVREQWSGPVAGTVEYGYNTNLLHSSEKVGGLQIDFGYDDDGLLTSAGALTYARKPSSGVVESSTVGSVTSTHTFDSYGESKTLGYAVGGTGLLSHTFDRDGLGRVKTLTEVEGGQTRSFVYGYNRLGQLETVDLNGARWRTYTYDGNGNRESTRDGSGPVVTAEFDAQDRLTRNGSVTFGYSATGNLLTRTDGAAVTRYGYDGFGRMTSAKLPDGREVAYLVDGLGRRVGREVDGVRKATWLYGQRSFGPVAELAGDGSVKTRFVYGASPVLPAYFERDGLRYRLVTDQLGSVRKVVQADTGEVVQALAYDPYGRVTSDTSPGFQPFGFAGGLTDPDTGLVLFGARDYSPELGRWMAKDPIGFAGGDSSLYAYVGGDPVNRIDPEGQSFWDAGAAVLGGVVTVSNVATGGLTSTIADAITGENTACYNGGPTGTAIGIVLPTGKVGQGWRAAKAARQQYVDGARALSAKGLERIAAGEPASIVARDSVRARNALKAHARQNMPKSFNRWAESRNMRKYGDPLGPRYEWFVGRNKSDVDIVRGAGRTGGFYNTLLGVK